MRIITTIILLIVFSLFTNESRSQEIGIGSWRDHLPYSKVISVTHAGDRIYAATPYSLFYLDLNDNSLNRVTKISGLSDVGISCIEYSQEFKTLIIAYSNANIDLLKGDEIINLSDIKRKPILGDKSIYSIDIFEDKAYLACGFGVVVLDVDEEEFPEPIYYIGPEGAAINVFDVTFNPADSLIYAATATGIYSSNFYTANLANFAEWKKEISAVLTTGSYNKIAAFHNRIYVNRSGPNWADDQMFVKENGSWAILDPTNTSDIFSLEVHADQLLICMNLAVEIRNPDGTMRYRIWTYSPEDVLALDAMSVESDVIWIGDEKLGLTRVINQYNDEHFVLNGPDFPDAFALSSEGDDVWIVSGGRTSSFEPLYRPIKFAGFVDGQWLTIDDKIDTVLDDNRDALAVAINPANHKNVFIGTMGYGLLEYNNGEFTTRYTPANSSIQQHVLAPERIDVTGLAFDNNNNLWVVNSYAASILSRKTPAGEWKSYFLGSTASGIDVDKIVIDQSNQKWLLGRNLNLYVFSDNDTPDDVSDDQTKRLTKTAGNGALVGSFVKSIAVDREGLVWLGTDEGIVVFYSPQNVFTGQNFDAQKVLIEQDGYGQYLLETETVTAIAVDGSNRKWFGTDRAGLFLMSADGTEQIAHFTEENSPLLSNSITGLTINETGEVFIATSKGLISYRSESVPPKETLSEVQVFPNPVYGNYTGNIAIRGLVENSNVKITDIAGNIVYSTKAEGGQAVWNGYNFDGKKATTGVYLVFISNLDGSKTEVTKIMMIN